MVDLKNATRSPPPAGLVRHPAVRGPTTRRIRARVVGDGPREKYRGRQFDGVESPRGATLERTGATGRSEFGTDAGKLSRNRAQRHTTVVDEDNGCAASGMMSHSL